MKPSNRSLGETVLDTIDRHIRWLFPAPAILVAGGLFIYPFIRLIWLSFNDWMLTTRQAPDFIGLANYIHAFTQDTHFWKSIWLTLYFTLGSVAGQFIIGFGLALALNRKFKGESVFRTFMLFPIIATPVSMSLVWSMLMNPMMGHLNYYLSLFGLGPSEWAASRATVMPSLIMVEIWHWTPMTMLILLAGLKSLPQDPYEAAIMDGASKMQVFFKITLPLMQPYIFLVLLLRFVHGMKVFDKIYVIASGGGPNRASETLNLMIYHEAFRALNFGYASALGMIMLVIILAVTIVLYRFRERKWRY
jgi:multiple sugar transport system permease protein